MRGRILLAVALVSLPRLVLAQFPGGFVETDESTTVRPALTQSQIQAFVPATRGPFTFPAPYQTRGIRLTIGDDCGGTDCVSHVGYSYWRNINNHVGSDTMLIFLGLDRARGGSGPTLFRYNKVTDEVTVLGPLFDEESSIGWNSAEGWYFSATMPTTLYLDDGVRFRRFDVITKQLSTVYDITAQFGTDVHVWQPHSSDDDRVHSASLIVSETGEASGCVVYFEDTSQFRFFPSTGGFDECQIDKSGRWLLIKEQIQSPNDADNLIVDLQNGTERVILDEDGAGGHSDNGYGYMIAADNWADQPNAYRLWKFGDDPLHGTLVYHGGDWSLDAPGHVSHANARPGAPPEEQYVCGAGASRTSAPRTNEVVCFGLDGSQRALVVAPVMTDLDAPGGDDDYSKSPLGNLDVTGQYFIWTSNLGGNRLDAFLVKVPAQLLSEGATDVVPPTVSLTAPAEGALLTGLVLASATATDNYGVAGVRLKVDDALVGAEVTTAPYVFAFDSAALPNGPHTLFAVARDAAGHVTTSAPVAVTVTNNINVVDVTWTNLVQATADGSALQKAGGCSGCGDSGANSAQGIVDGYGYLELTAGNQGPESHVGLSARHTGTLPDDIDFAIHFTSDAAEVREKGIYRTDISFVPGDVFRIAVEFGVAKYYKNDVLFYTGTVPPSYPLFAYASLLSLGGGFTRAVIASQSGWVPDLAAPVVSMMAPLAGAIVGGTVNLMAAAADDIGVAGVQFKVDGVALIPELTSAPFVFAFNSTTVPDGPHVLSAVARDDAGHLSSAAVPITVANVTIIDINSVQVAEGNSGMVNLNFLVTRSGAMTGTVTVTYATANGTATSVDDYVAKSGTLNFGPNIASRTVTVQVRGDTTPELNETFFVNISASPGVTLAHAQGQGTILNDDGWLTCPTYALVPGVSFNTTVVEGSSAQDWVATFTPGAPNTTWVGALKLVPLPRPATVSMTAPTAGAYELRLISGDSGATIASCTYQVSSGPALVIDDVTVLEGNAGTTTATFHVTLSSAPTGTVTVNYATANGTATAGTDYVAKSSPALTFNASNLSRTVAVVVNGDTTPEPSETFFLNITSVVGNAGVLDGQGQGTITDDDTPPPAVSISDVVVTEGNTGTVNAVFNVTLSAAATRTTTVNFATANGTATAGTDYVAKSGTVTFNNGDIAKTVTVVVNGDVTVEDNETFFVNLSSPSQATIGDGQGQGTITDDDPPPTVSINDVTVTEGNAGTVNAVFNVTLSAAATRTTTVDFATANGTATAGTDYVAKSGTVTFNVGDTVKTVTVVVNGDINVEGNETFFVNLSAPSQATLGDGQGQGTITDDDPPPTVSISDVTVTEGNAGTVNAVFNVTLSAAATRTTTVDFATADGAATAGTDYVAHSGTLTFNVGETVKTVTVVVNGDVNVEDNETFFVNLSSPSWATIADGQGQGTITDDDPPPTVSIDDVTVTEGNTGTVNAVFNVTLSAAATRTTTVDFATADGTATAGTDYVAHSGTLTFNVGDTVKTVTVVVNGDINVEDNETFFIHLSSPSWATIGRGQGQGTITDDDPPPTVSVNDVTVTEGNAGTVNAIFNVTLSAAATRTITVDFATADGTATAGTDYVAHSGTLTFNVGDTVKTVTVVVNGDINVEDNETFFVHLSSPSSATIGRGQGQGTITDDDPPPTVSIDDVTLTEGNTGTVNAVFNVTLSAAATRTTTVDFATADGTAAAGTDYVAHSGTLTFNVGEIVKTVTVVVNGDINVEDSETFFVNLSSPSWATIGDGQGQGTITDDDPPPTVSINDVTVTEGNTGTVNAVFDVTLSAAATRTTTVDFATADGTATAGSDYVAHSGTVTFNVGDTVKTVTVVVNGDINVEDNETFFVHLSSPSSATIGDGQGQGKITDDDPPPTVSISDVTVTEGNAGTVNAVFNVSLSAAATRTTTVDFATADGTATAGSDYVAHSGTLTFNVGDTVKTITVVVNGDINVEDNETFFVNLTAPSQATIGDGQGLGTITDDDPLPTVSIDDVTVTEGNTGTVNAVFNVTLSAAATRTITVDFATADGTATAGTDYAAHSGTLTFNVGDTAKTVTVVVNGDINVEDNETFFVNLTAPSQATISRGQGQGTITDDDPAPTVSIDDVTVTEGNTGTVNAVFNVTLSAVATRTTTVDFATADGTATAGTDYAAHSGTLTFNVGDTVKTIMVVVNGDINVEDNEAFFVNLSSPSHATIGDGQGQGTITDDDPPPTVSINDVTVTEGNSGTVNAVFNVTLSAAATRTITVDFATADGTATAGTDYVAHSGTLTFNVGDTVKTITVVVNGDINVEDNETFFVNLSLPSQATISDGQGQGTITDDDPPPSVSINDVTVTEGNAGTVNATFNVTLSAAATRTITVAFATANGTATAGTDYVAHSGTLTFNTGDTVKTVTVQVNGDTTPEANETFFVNLSTPSGATISDGQGQGAITDDDTSAAPLTCPVSPVAPGASFNATVNGGSSVKDWVASYVPGSPNNPWIGTYKYAPLPRPATVSMAAPTTAGTYELRLLANDTFTSIGSCTYQVGTVTAPSLSINDVTVTEGNTGMVNATFSVTLSPAATGTVTVSFATANGTATAGTDYVANSGTLTFGTGETVKMVTVQVNGDTTPEATETFFVNLSTPSGATISDGQGQGTITDDDSSAGMLTCPVSPVAPGASFNASVNGGSSVKDWLASYMPGSPNNPWLGTYKYAPLPRPATVSMTAPTTAGTYELRLLANDTFTSIGSCTYQVTGPPSLSINDVSVTEGNTGTVNATFSVTLSPAATGTVTVSFATADGTATAGTDYVANSGTLTFNAGDTVKTVAVVVNGDTTWEANETFFLNLSAPSGATISDSQGQATITNDDTGAGALTCPVAPVAPGAFFSTTVSAGSSAKDWVATYTLGAPNTTWIGQFKYVPLPRPASATMTAPGAAGAYELRLLSNDTFTLIGSCTFQVAN